MIGFLVETVHLLSFQYCAAFNKFPDQSQVGIPTYAKVTFKIDEFTSGNPDMDKYMGIRVQSTLFSTDRLKRFSRFPWVHNRGIDHSEASGQAEALECAVENFGILDGPLNRDEDSFGVDTFADSNSHIVEELALAKIAGQSSDSASYDDGDDAALINSIFAPPSTLDWGQFDGNEVKLHCNVRLQLTTVIPPGLSFIPNPVLGSMGRIILRAILNALLPNFLELASKDYQRWVAGERSNELGVGSLAGA